MSDMIIPGIKINLDEYFKGLVQDIEGSKTSTGNQELDNMRTSAIALRIIGGICLLASTGFVLTGVVLIATNPLSAVLYLVFGAIGFVVSRDTVIWGMNKSNLTRDLISASGSNHKGVIEKMFDVAKGGAKLVAKGAREFATDTPEELRNTWILQHIYKAVKNFEKK